jgi:hypothetical protein
VVGGEREELVLARIAAARAIEDVTVRLDDVDGVLVHVAQPEVADDEAGAAVAADADVLGEAGVDEHVLGLPAGALDGDVALADDRDEILIVRVRRLVRIGVRAVAVVPSRGLGADACRLLPIQAGITRISVSLPAAFTASWMCSKQQRSKSCEFRSHAARSFCACTSWSPVVVASRSWISASCAGVGFEPGLHTTIEFGFTRAMSGTEPGRGGLVTGRSWCAATGSVARTSREAASSRRFSMGPPRDR